MNSLKFYALIIKNSFISSFERQVLPYAIALVPHSYIRIRTQIVVLPWKSRQTSSAIVITPINFFKSRSKDKLL